MRDQAKIDAANTKINEARAALDKARRSFDQIYRRQEKIILAEMAKDEMTLELALEAYINGHMSNERGFNWLNERQWKGAWAGTGIGTSGYWQETMQTQVRLRISREMSQADLLRTAEILETEVIPVIKPGALDKQRGFENFKGAKVINIMDRDLSESRDPMLLIHGGKYYVIDARYFNRFGNDKPKWEGYEIMGALDHIHAYFHIGDN